jgi:hypothetical protein
MTFLTFGTQVQIVNTASDLDGLSGTILGVASEHPGMVFYIVLLKEKRRAPKGIEIPEFDYMALTMIGSCLSPL